MRQHTRLRLPDVPASVPTIEMANSPKIAADALASVSGRHFLWQRNMIDQQVRYMYIVSKRDDQMPDVSTESFKRILDPMERNSETLFGVIMVLTVTGSLGIDHAKIGTMLFAALRLQSGMGDH